MKSATACLAALILFMANTGQASGLSKGSLYKPESSTFASEYGSTLPPVGYVRYCMENAKVCQPNNAESNLLALTPDRWRMLIQVNKMVNSKIQPVSDLDQYGELERWSLPVDKGDCEDYVLLKQQYLESLGFAPGDLLITVVLDETGAGHAVLTVSTQNGDFVLDNRRNDVLRWNETGYNFLKRQSQENPRHWVALREQKTKLTGEISASAAGN
jgi:predicted transglutaminase-like cysteine proteinase